MPGVLMKMGGLETDTGRMPCEGKGRDQGDALVSQQSATGSQGRGTKWFLPTTSERGGPADTLISDDTWPPGLWDSKCVLFKPPVHSAFYSSPRKLLNHFTPYIFQVTRLGHLLLTKKELCQWWGF